MKRLMAVLAVLMLLAPAAHAEPPFVAEYHWVYTPDSTDLFISQNAVEGPAYTLGMLVWQWEIDQTVWPDSTNTDSVQFSLWGLKQNYLYKSPTWDSITSFIFVADTATTLPLHKTLAAADSVWIYDMVRIQARWKTVDTTIFGSPTWISRLVAKRQ